MFQSFSNTWHLLGSSMDVLRRDKELLVFPIVSGLVSLLVMATFVGGAWGTGLIDAVLQEQQAANSTGDDEAAALTRSEIIAAVVGFTYYFVSYFVVIYFNAALIGAAHIRLTGGDPTVADGFRAANACLPGILLYTLIAATVGLVLRMIRENSDNIVARIVAGMMGLAWTLITFLVIPVIVIERKNAIAAIGRSSRLLKETWGEQIVSNIGFGLMGFLLALPGFVLVVIAFLAFASEVGLLLVVTLGTIAVLYWVTLAIVLSALKGIFVAALYAHAAHEPLEAFPREVVADAFRPR